MDPKSSEDKLITDEPEISSTSEKEQCSLDEQNVSTGGIWSAIGSVASLIADAVLGSKKEPCHHIETPGYCCNCSDSWHGGAGWYSGANHESRSEWMTRLKEGTHIVNILRYWEIRLRADSDLRCLWANTFSLKNRTLIIDLGDLSSARTSEADLPLLINVYGFDTLKHEKVYEGLIIKHWTLYTEDEELFKPIITKMKDANMETLLLQVGVFIRDAWSEISTVEHC